MAGMLSYAVQTLNSRRRWQIGIATGCLVLFLGTVVGGAWLTVSFSSALSLDIAAANGLIRDLSQAKSISEVLTFADERAAAIKKIDETATKLAQPSATTSTSASADVAVMKELADTLKQFKLQEAHRQDAALDDNSTWSKVGKLSVVLKETSTASGIDIAVTAGLRITMTVMVLLLARVLWAMYRYSVECHAQLLDRIEVLDLVSGNAPSMKALQQQLVRSYPCKRAPVPVVGEGELAGHPEKPPKPDDKNPS